MFSNHSKTIFLILSLFFSTHSVANATKEIPYTVSIVPQLSTLETYQQWEPVLEKLSEKTGLKFELKLAETIPAFEQQLSHKEPDFAFMNPYHLMMAHKKKTYLPLLRNSSNLLRGIIVIKNDSTISSLSDLNGKELAFPAPNSFGATLYIRGQLEKNQVKITPIYVKTHSNVYRGVLMGDQIAGGGINITFEQEPEDVRKKLKILYTSPEFPPHPFCASSRIPKSIREKVIDAFIQLSNNEDTAKLLKTIQIPKPIKADYSRDYKQLETLNLDKFVVTIKN